MIDGVNFVAYPAITAALTFTSLTLDSNGVGSVVFPVIKFTPFTSVSPMGTLTITTPQNYFSGSPSFIAGASNIAGMTGSSGSQTTTTVVIIIGGNPTTTGAVVITLSGLTLGNAVGAGTFSMSSSGDVTASTTQTAPAILLSVTTFASVTMAYTGAGSPVTPVLVFTPAISLDAGQSITLGMPAGYFIGTATFAAAATNIALLTGSATAVSAADRQIVITTAGAATTTGSVTVTLSGLTLGAIQATGVFTLSTSKDLGTKQLSAPAIVTAVAFTSITMAYNGANSAVKPVLVFTPTTTVLATGGTITLTMPQNYFTGTPSFAAGDSSVSGMTGTNAASTSTQLVLTIGGNPTGTSAVTITLSGLTLGAIQPASSFSLATSADPGTVQKPAPLICSSLTLTIVTAYNVVSNISGAAVSPVLVFTPTTSLDMGKTITLNMPAGYFVGTATFAATATNIPLLTGSATAVTATSTQIIITTAGAATGTVSVRVTLSGLTLGPAQAAGTCSLTTFADACISPASQFPLTAIRAAPTPAAVASSAILLPWVTFVTAVAVLVAALAF